MAVIDSFTLVSGTNGTYGASFAGFRSTSEPYQCGTVNGSTSAYGVDGNWYSNVTLSRLDYESYSGFSGIWLELRSSSSPSNSGWYDVKVGGNAYRRVDASYATASFQATWAWNNQSNPFSSGTSYSINVTDDGTLGETGVNIPLGISSGAIDMNTLRNFFGEPTYNSNTIAMSNLYKGGDLVPNISGNSSIPTSGTISLSNFYNANTTLIIDKHPVNKFIFAGFGQTGTAEVAWNQSILPTGEGDVDIGYKALKSVLEYRWVINVTFTQGSVSGLSRIIADGVTSYMSGNSHTTAWGDTMTLILQVDHGLSTGTINGTAYMEARQVWNGSTYTVTTNQAFWDITIESAGE